MVILIEPITLTPPEPTAGVFTAAWITGLSVVSDPQGKTSVRALFQPWNPQTNELAPGSEHTRRMVIEDMFATAAADPQFAGVITALLLELERQAKLAGVLS